MKRYYNSSTQEWYNEGDNITRKIDNGVFTGIPSVEQLTEWGFVEWITPAPTPEQLLEQAKANKIADLEEYDSSDAVNEFTVIAGADEIMGWFTPEQRSNYKNSLDAAELLGVDVVHPVFQGVVFELPVSFAKTSLAQIQLYADKCYVVTEQHKAGINNLTSVEAVEAYDYTTGYPEKLEFNLNEI